MKPSAVVLLVAALRAAGFDFPPNDKPETLRALAETIRPTLPALADATAAFAEAMVWMKVGAGGTGEEPGHPRRHHACLVCDSWLRVTIRHLGGEP